MGINVWLERTSATPLTEKKPHAELSPVQSVSAATVEPETSLNVESLDWQALRSVVAGCQNCELAKTRSQTVFGVGKQTASLIILGDAPSEEDEQQGEPFSGEPGKLLTAMLKAMGYKRSDVYILNTIKCKKVKNKEPSVDEAMSCEPYLIRQINLLQPELILALGNFAAQRLLKTKSTLSRLRGQLHYVDGINAPIVVSYHPVYLLRAANEKRKAWEDLQIVMKELKL